MGCSWSKSVNIFTAARLVILLATAFKKIKYYVVTKEFFLKKNLTNGTQNSDLLQIPLFSAGCDLFSNGHVQIIADTM